MKKLVCLILATLLFLAGCAAPSEPVPQDDPPEQESKAVGVWISHTELKGMFTSPNGFREDFARAVENCRDLGVTDLIVQVRPFCDALYESALFPMPDYAKNSGDPLIYMVDQAHGAGMKLHAWINPYRVLSSGDLSKVNANSPIWNLPENAVAEVAGGVYLKASSTEAVRLVLDGVREIADRYAVDGIHIDDYFYPTDEEAFDREDYEQYLAACSDPLSLDDWRRSNVNGLVAGISGICRARGLSFGISPAADNEKNYRRLYADVAYWCETGLCDYIAPQLYFGFEYPDERFRYDRLVSVWSALAVRYGVRLYIGLASYKIGTEQTPDAAEWGSHSDILARQVGAAKQAADGVLFFSYSSLFSGEERNKAERENLVKEMENQKWRES